MSVYEAAQQFLEARRQFKQARHHQQELRLKVQQSQARLNEVFEYASNLVVGDSSESEDELFAGLSSFSIVQDGVCHTLVFCEGHLHSVIEGPILGPPSSP